MSSKPALIVRMPNWIGDAVMSLPTLNALEQAGIDLVLVGKPFLQNLLKGTHFQVHTLPKKNSEARAFLKKIPIVPTLLLTNSFSSAWMMYLSGKKTVGYQQELRSFLLTRRTKKQGQPHEVVCFFDIGRFAVTTFFPSLHYPNMPPAKITLPIDPVAQEKILRLLKEKNMTRPYIILAPFAHGKSKEGKSKIWPDWLKLMKKLGNTHQLIICPGQNELDLCAPFLADATILTDVSLSEYMALMKQAQLVIANDSGPMHLAAAVNAPVLGLFGSTDPTRTSPWGGKHLERLGAWPDLPEVLSTSHSLLNDGISTD